MAGGASAADGSRGGWFHHEFGELRSYHGDWLAVCGESGAGSCRAVQYLFDSPTERDTFFGDARLEIDRAGGAARLEFYRRGAPDRPLGPVSLEIGRRSWVLLPGKHVAEARTGGGGTIAESFEIADPALADQITAAMRTGRRLRIGYQDVDGRRHDTFSLRGFAGAMRAIEQVQAKR